MAKKTFKDSIIPAMSFISKESIEKEIKESYLEKKTEPLKDDLGILKKDHKLNHAFIETKSQRLQLLIQPSLKLKLKEKAKKELTSVNDLVHRILQDKLKDD